MSRSLALHEDAEQAFQIAPMVDVVFVLMLFFMASAGTLTKEKELNVQTPSGGIAHDEPIVINISAEGQVTVNNKVFGAPSDHELRSMREWLKTTIRQFGNEELTLIHPSPATRHDRIMDVLNAVGQAGVKRIAFS